MLYQLIYEAKSVRVCGISELSLVPSIPMCSMIMIFFVCVFDVTLMIELYIVTENRPKLIQL